MPRHTTSNMGRIIKHGIVSFTLATLILIHSLAFADQITLNLKEADIRALISTVSKVTVVSAKTMSEDEVYEVFLSILQVHGYAAVPVGSVIKIVPEVNAKQGPLPTNTGEKGDALITRVMTLDHVPAAQLVPILRPLVPQQGHLAAYNPTNTLIITDHAANIRRLSQIVREIDKPESDELEIIPLKHASASELVRILNSLHSSGAGAKTPESKDVTLASDDRTNSILMSGERAVRLKLRATIAHLDTPLDNDAGNTHVIYLKYAKAEDIVKILSGVQKSQTTAAAKGIKKTAAATSGQAEADIQSDEATNAVIITAGPDVVRRMKSLRETMPINSSPEVIGKW